MRPSANLNTIEQDAAAIMDAAVAIELLHNATLIHDDIMDEDELRRGKPTVWKLLLDWKTANRPGQDISSGKLFHSGEDLFAVSHGILAGNILISE